MDHITPQRLREVLTYDEMNGEFRWRVTLSCRAVAGKRAGYIGKQCGSLLISIDGYTYTAQRLAWAYIYGEWPKRRVLPSDGNLANTSRQNLLLAPSLEDELTADTLRAAFAYDPSTGLFTRRQTRGSAKEGSIAGCPMNKGYFVIRIGAKLLLVHRLAWLYVHGKWPDGQIDHINGDRTDNRIVNLRDVTPQVNSQNLRSGRGATGLIGAHVVKRRTRLAFKSSIGVNGRQTALGIFDSPEEAHSAYVAAKRRLHVGCTI